MFVGSESESDKMKQKLVVQKRTDIKDYCPGYWDACTGGVMQEGEEYASVCDVLVCDCMCVCGRGWAGRWFAGVGVGLPTHDSELGRR